MDFSEKWGRDVEEAVNLALIDLKLERDQVDVIVLEEPSKGFLGFGSKLAKVRVQKISSKEEKEKSTEKIDQSNKNVHKKEQTVENKPAVRAESKKENRKERISNKKEKKQIAPKENTKYSTVIREKPENLQELDETPALDFLKEITAKMGLELTIKAYANEECLYFDISGKDSGTIIGKRGQTLDSIQYLTSLVVNKNAEKYTRVIVDAENYREKRERTLEQLANRLADKVHRSGKSVRLEPMNPYERKVIHATLQKNPAVSTRSEGEEPYRRVIIERK